MNVLSDPGQRVTLPPLLAMLLAIALVAITPPTLAVVMVDDFEDGCATLCFPFQVGQMRNGFLLDNDMRILNFNFYDGTFTNASGTFPVTATPSPPRVTGFPSGDEVMWNGSAHLTGFSGPTFRFLGAEFAGWDIGTEFGTQLGNPNHVPSTTIVLQGYVGGVLGTLVESATYSLTTDAFIHASGFAANIDTLVIRSDPASVPLHSWLMDDFTWEVPEPSTLTLMGLGLFGLGFNRRKKLQ